MNENRFKDLKEKASCFAAGSDIQNVTAYLNQLSEKEKDRLIEEANLAMRQTVIFRDSEDGSESQVAHKMDEEMWIQHYEENPQWTYELNRHDFLYKLLYGYKLTGNKMYVDKLRWYIFDWMIKSPVTLSGSATTRPADTGRRCLNWCGLILQMIVDGAIDEEDTVVYLQNMGMQFAYLRRRYVGSNTIDSQAVPQTAAMCAAYLWFREFLPEEEKLEQWAWRELKQQLELQVLEDGSLREETNSCLGQEAKAHRLVLDTCEKLWQYCVAAEKAGVKLCDEARAAVKAQTESGKETDGVKEDDGNSTARTGWLTSAVRRMRRYLLYVADANGRLPGPQESAEALYLYTQDSGKLCIRSDWSEQADYTWMSRGKNPYVREKDGCCYAEMLWYGSASENIPCSQDACLQNSCLQNSCPQTSSMVALPDGIWVFGQNTECRSMEGQNEKEMIWLVAHGGVTVKIRSQKVLELKPLNENDAVVLAPADVEAKRAAVFQFGRPAPVAKNLVTALDFKLPSGESRTVVVWKGEVKTGSQMFLCHGVPICGNVVVLCGKDGEFKRILLKD